MEIRKSEKIDEIAKALVAFQAEMKPIEKDQTAKVQTRTGGEYTYQYADWTSMHEQAKPVLAKHGLALVQHPFEAPDGVGMTSLVLHLSGQWLEGSFVLALPHVKETKNGLVPLTPQEYGSGVTYARRYGGAAILGLHATDEDDDGAAAQAHARAARPAARAAAPKAHANPPGRPAPGAAQPPPAQPGAKPAGGPSLGPDGNPRWFPDPIGGTGQFANLTWAEMAKGSVDGRRHRWLRWAVYAYKDSKDEKVQLVHKKIAWLLDKKYGDDSTHIMEHGEHAETDAEMEAAHARAGSPESTIQYEPEWEPGSNG